MGVCRMGWITIFIPDPIRKYCRLVKIYSFDQLKEFYQSIQNRMDFFYPPLHEIIYLINFELNLIIRQVIRNLLAMGL